MNSVFDNGLFHSGDYGRKDKEGFFYFHGRQDSLIIKGGENVYPAEIERRLEEFFVWVIDSVVEGTGCLDEVGGDPGRVAHDEIDREWELQVLRQPSVERQIFLLIGLRLQTRRFL